MPPVSPAIAVTGTPRKTAIVHPCTSSERGIPGRVDFPHPSSSPTAVATSSERHHAQTRGRGVGAGASSSLAVPAASIPSDATPTSGHRGP